MTLSHDCSAQRAGQPEDLKPKCYYRYCLKILLSSVLFVTCAGQSCSPTTATVPLPNSDEQVLGYHPTDPPASVDDIDQDSPDQSGNTSYPDEPQGSLDPINDNAGNTDAPIDDPDTSHEGTTSNNDEPSTPADEPNEPVVAVSPAAHVVIVPALERIFREDTDIAGESSIQLQAARGETESCQIVVVNDGAIPLKNINLEWPQTDAGNPTRPVLTPYRVHYVEVKTPSFSVNSTPGWYPDALIPFFDPYLNQYPTAATYKAAGYDLPTGQCQPYWLDITIPYGTPAGIYEEVIRITADGYVRDITVQTTVWDFDLPAAPSLPMRIQVSNVSVTKAFKFSNDNARLVTLLNRHRDILKAHRLPPHPLPDVPYDLNTGNAVVTSKYLDSVRDRLTKYPTRTCSIGLQRGWPFPDGLGADQNKMRTYLRDIDQMLKANSWIPPAYIYVIDEPRTIEAYQQVVQVGDMVHSQELGIDNLVTGRLSTFYGWPSLANAIDRWVYDWKSWDSVAVLVRKAAGHQVWAYSALTPHPNRPAPTWELDAPILDYMVPFWTSWSLQLDGMLYWCALAYALDSDPWVDPLTYQESGNIYNGEGSLMLSGLPAGVDGPVSTIRLKILRDGLECYDYLAILADRGGREISNQIATGLSPTFSSWSPDYHDYLAAREELANAILVRTGQ